MIRRGVGFPAVEHERDLPFEDEERFLLAPMDMRRWPAAGQHAGLAKRIRAAGLFAGRQETIDIAHGGKNRALARGMMNNLGWGGHGFGLGFEFFCANA